MIFGYRAESLLSLAVEDELSLLGQTQILRDLVLEDVSTGRRDTSAETLARDYMAKNARETADKPMRSMVSPAPKCLCEERC